MKANDCPLILVPILIYSSVGTCIFITQANGFCQKKASINTKTTLSKAEFKVVKNKRTVTDEKIPKELVINWD